MGLRIILNSLPCVSAFFWSHFGKRWLWGLMSHTVSPFFKAFISTGLYTRWLQKCHQPYQVTWYDKVKMQYVHFRLHVNCFLLPWKIPEEISRQSMRFNNSKQYLPYVHTTFYHGSGLTWNWTFDENIYHVWYLHILPFYFAWQICKSVTSLLLQQFHRLHVKFEATMHDGHKAHKEKNMHITYMCFAILNLSRF